jgi:hypothetical protein
MPNLRVRVQLCRWIAAKTAFIKNDSWDRCLFSPKKLSRNWRFMLKLQLVVEKNVIIRLFF